MYKGNFQVFKYVRNIPQTKILKPILKPKIADLSVETEKISKEPSPERELKEVIDKTFAKRKEKKRKKALKDSESLEINPEITAIRSNEKLPELVQQPPKKKRIKKKPSIFDNY